MRWTRPAPRVDNPSTWMARLVEWLDDQDREEGIFSPVLRVVLNTTNPLNTNIQCKHSLRVPVLSASIPNVCWHIVGVWHNGTGTKAAVTAAYVDGTVGKNTIDLQFFCNGLTVNDANPMTVFLYFFPLPEEL